MLRSGERRLEPRLVDEILAHEERIRPRNVAPDEAIAFLRPQLLLRLFLKTNPITIFLTSHS